MNNTITVLVGWHAHRVSGRPVRNGGDAIALGLALRVAASRDVRVLCGGDMPDAVARDYLAQGAPCIEILQAQSHQADLVALLAPALRASTLVLTGTRAEGGLRSGALPYAIAEKLQRPLIPDVVALHEEAGTWLATQALPKGARRRLRVATPAVFAVHPAAPVTLRHSYRDQQAGRVLRHTVRRPESEPSPWQYVAASGHLQRLQALQAQSGHSRMRDAIATEQRSAAGTLLRDGSAEAKARAVFDYLQTHSLLSF
ncbi:hypothetical protein HLB44_35445 [Aquincola sp. S2]|uniref:Electron transfer flavoprotein alpha/beta-subunit N-terminal domain-containing protein n=1 Tax=Pseudaquabacterium terrae TaxID=2732868 RepID=A0ABX2EU66_9BURK|nr:hypothetical protein [Aquabacterium terrae]NRF72287.1 hypothetical protein [Aquabacterium terrae]